MVDPCIHRMERSTEKVTLVSILPEQMEGGEDRTGRGSQVTERKRPQRKRGEKKRFTAWNEALNK